MPVVYKEGNYYGGGGTGGTGDYEELDNRPQFNGTTWSGNKTTQQMIPIGDGLTFGTNGELKLDYQEFQNVYGGKTVIIGGANQNMVDHIYVATPPTKTVYFVNAPLDLTGIVVKAVYQDGTETDVTNACTFDPPEGTPVTSSVESVTVGWVWDYTLQQFTDDQAIALQDPPSWADGTDEEIIEALNMHYAGTLDLTQYWHVGDVRKVNLSAVTPLYSVETSTALSNLDLVLMNVGGKELTTPINDHTECAFVVGFAFYLGDYSYFKLNETATNVGGWDACPRRTWLNEVFPNAFSSSIRSIFKQHKNITGKGGTIDETIVSDDYFALPAGKEIWGSSSTLSQSSENAALTQFTYFENATNRQKYRMCWTRSPIHWTSGSFVTTDSNGNGGYYAPNSTTNSMAPITVI